MICGKIISYTQGRDSVIYPALNSRSFGWNIFLPNVPPYRQGDRGYSLGDGWKTQVIYASFLLSYELRENLFLEVSALVRNQETKTAPIETKKSSVVTFGVRWNMHRREIDF
jgi:hypothetical protein